MTIGIGLDGVLLNYDHKADGLARVNLDFLDLIQDQPDRDVAIITNAGGMVFHPLNPVKYPSVVDFVSRLEVAYGALLLADFYLVGMYICIAHPMQDEAILQDVYAELLPWKELNPAYNMNIYTDLFYRKPKPSMLQVANVDCYYGLDDEHYIDEQTAGAAGISFIGVKKFV